ncbi:MAG: alpha/beta hydrolase [Reyranellaceae bacterium]
MRTNIAFETEDGTTLRGWHYRPAPTGVRQPTIVLAHGFSAVKEMYLDRFAEAFAAAGLGALVFDHRGFGASDGRVRQEVDPEQQIRDWRDAISFAETLESVDPEQIGIWGTSYSGGHAIAIAANDRRVKCVVAQVPMVSGPANARRLIRADLLAPTQRLIEADRRARWAGQPPAMVPVVSADPMGPAALPTADSHAWFTETARARAPAWRNEVTVRSLDLFLGYDPASLIALISPTPLLMIVGLADHLTPADLALAAYERALQPKRLVTLPGGHFDAYLGDFASASAAAVDWFRTHLA